MLENLTAMEMVNSMSSKQVRTLYRESLRHRNVLTLVTATKVLAKRGNYDVITAEVYDMFEESELDLTADFAVAFSNSLFELKNAAPVLGELGKSISHAINDGCEVYDFEKFRIELSGEFSGMSYPAFEGYLDCITAQDLITMKLDKWDSIVGYLVDGHAWSAISDKYVIVRFVHHVLRLKFEEQIEEISQDKANAERMESKIIRDLDIKFKQ